MKLRLETGNFKIVGTYDSQAHTLTVNALPKGLSSEDFLGCVVDFGSDGLCVITRVSVPSENVITLGAGNMQLAYNILTGVVTVTSA